MGVRGGSKHSSGGGRCTVENSEDLGMWTPRVKGGKMFETATLRHNLTGGVERRIIEREPSAPEGQQV